MIALFPDGTWQIKRHMCSCEACKWGLFNECTADSTQVIMEADTNDVVDADGVDSLDEIDGVEPEMFTFIEDSTFVAMYSSSKSLELFYLFNVVGKDIADTDKIDIYGHSIQHGAEYIHGYYMEKINEKKGKVFYKQLKKVAHVYPYKIFCPSVSMDKDGLFLTAEEYQFLADAI